MRQMIDGVHSFIQQLFTESQLCARNILGAGNKTGTLNFHSNGKVQVINLTNKTISL